MIAALCHRAIYLDLKSVLSDVPVALVHLVVHRVRVRASVGHLVRGGGRVDAHPPCRHSFGSDESPCINQGRDTSECLNSRRCARL